ncbi:hypothetical protein [Fundidesulfovibrio terrae]|uniref:hypothetical protein n=1 Tax=Fundidesulfovibrio terrae TaxID=2922866 RepID=UPI001FAEE58A|nr:hypothetical protein [Fundidesulfovibrio terrae]
MPNLPVFSTIGQAMAVFGLHIGALSKWALIPFFLSAAALGAAFGLGLWLQPPGGAGFPYWWMGFLPAAIFCLVAWTPYAIRVNQLAVAGRVEPVGYLETMFSSVGLRYLAYAIIVGFIQLAGIAISALPVLLVAHSGTQDGNSSRVVLAVALTVVLVLAFFILTSPLNLVYPAAALEREPSLGRAYNLGAHRKLRLFACVFLTAALFGVLGQVVEFAASAMGAQKSGMVRLAFVPVQILLSFFSYVTATAVPAVAYRILAGLPDPRGAEPVPGNQPSGTSGSSGTPAVRNAAPDEPGDFPGTGGA